MELAHHFHMHTNVQSSVTGRQRRLNYAVFSQAEYGQLKFRGSIIIERKENGYWKPTPLLPVGGDNQDGLTSG